MIKIEETEVVGLRHVIRGMRNPMNSWEQSDSGICKGGDAGLGCENCANEASCTNSYDHEFKVGKEDYCLMEKLRDAGTDHRKYMRMLVVYLDITAPLYWWKEFDTYKVGTVANSCSTMHKIAAKEFTLDDFSHEHLISRDEGWDDFTCSMENGEVVLHSCSPMDTLQSTCNMLNFYRNLYLKESHPDDIKTDWWQMIQLLPSSYNQKRTIMLNYEVLANIYKSRRLHKLDEWRIFCAWIESLPYRYLITGKDA